MAKKKYLIETSAVRPALGSSTTAHNDLFREFTKDGELWTSVYVRHEFIRRWICDMVRIAIAIDHCDNVRDALILLEQDFAPRSVKGTLACVARLLQENGAIDNKRTAVEEVATQALRWINQFDNVLGKQIPNRCHCQLGGRELNVDYNHILEDLHSFYESFKAPIMDCQVNAFLEFRQLKGRTALLLANESARSLKVGENLHIYAEKQTWVTCRECVRIADAVIAMEQPPSWHLVHIDSSFDVLCEAHRRPHVRLESVIALDKKQFTEC